MLGCMRKIQLMTVFMAISCNLFGKWLEESVAICCVSFFFFFFSSRRRHTRCSRDWSSDVCSSDLAKVDTARAALGGDLRALALIDLGIAEAWTARFDAAYRHLDDGIALARRIGRPYLEVTGLAHLAQLESWRSFRLGAERGLQAIELATEHGWADEPVAGLAYLALGVAVVTPGRLQEAGRALGPARRTGR